VALVGGVARVVLLQMHLQFPSRLETGFASRHCAHILGWPLVQLAMRVQVVNGGEFATAALVRALCAKRLGQIIADLKLKANFYQKVLFLQVGSLVSLKPKMGVE
jgi:hypothetical protein